MKKILFPAVIFLLVAKTDAQTPVAYYPFNGNANDAIGTLHGTVTAATLTADFVGNPSSAYYFNAAANINLGNSTVIRPTAQLTVSGWFTLENTAGAVNGRAMISNTENGGYNISYDKPTNLIRGNIRRNGSFATIGTSAVPYLTGWHFATLTYDGRFTRLYLDAVEVDNNDAGAVFPIQYNSSVNTYIGVEAAASFGLDATRYWQGNIDEVKFYSVALTPAQILAEFNTSNLLQKPGSGNAISFDGTNDMVKMVHSASTVFTNNYTLECWIKPAAFGFKNGIISKFHTAASNGFTLRLSGTGSFRGIDFDEMTTADNLLNANQWYHLSAVNDNGTRRLYINGMEITLTGTALTFNTANTDSVIIGKDFTAGAGRFFNGQIDEVRIWNVPLTQTQVRDRMCKKITASDALFSNLVVYNKFDELAGAITYDSTANANNGTMTNGPARVTSGAHIGNASAHNYSGAASSASLVHPVRGDALTATLTAGGADGVQVYCVTQYPNIHTGISAIPGNNGYFGVFPVNGTGTQYTAIYNYTGITGITDENYVRLFRRADNAVTSWLQTTATLNIAANTLTATGQNTEYIVGEIPPPKVIVSGATNGDFNTLKEAFDFINASGGSGNVTVTIMQSTTETASAILNQNNYNVTVKPNTSATVSGTINGAVIKLNGADNVTIDGSNNGSSSRDLTIINNSTAAGIAAIWLSSTGVGAGATNNTIKNCNISCGPDQSTGSFGNFGIVINGAITNVNTAPQQDNDNNTYQNNFISRVDYGIFSFGENVANPNQNTTISNNLIGPAAFGSNQIKQAGIVMVFEDNGTVTGNEVRCVGALLSQSGQSGSDRVGIAIGSLDTWPGSSSNFARNMNITRNKVHDVVEERTFSAVGILLSGAGANPSNNLLANNFIYNIRANGIGGDQAIGIALQGTGGGVNDKVVFNSVYLSGDIDPGTATTATGSCAGVVIGFTSFTDLTFKNNAIHVDLNSNTSSLKHYNIVAPSSAYAWGTGASDYNDYFFPAANTQMALGGLGTFATSYTAVSNLSLWRTTFTPNQDANSKNINPEFTSTTDLHVVSNISCGLSGAGTPITGITNDFDSDSRDAITPDMGADEFTATPSLLLAATAGGGQVCSNETVGSTGTIYNDGACKSISKLVPNGANPVSGLVNTCVTIDATVQTYNSHAYVQRHFDITPALNQATATARLTLYLLQSEFDSYNANNGTDPDLPTGPGDLTGISNLRVTKYSGNGTAPGNYVPGIETIIDPADADIIWNGNYWEISFNVTGFSGFYIQGSTGTLPITLLSFSGYKDGNSNQLRWTTVNEINNRGFDLQRSTDGINYLSIGFVNSIAPGGNSPAGLNYSFTDNNVTGTKQYYRLRQEDMDGRSRFSHIVLIKGEKPTILVMDGLFPNPAQSVVNLMISSPGKEKLTMIITDITGRVMMQKTIIAEQGSNTIPVDISHLAGGTYLVKLFCDDQCMTIGKFIRQ